MKIIRNGYEIRFKAFPKDWLDICLTRTGSLHTWFGPHGFHWWIAPAWYEHEKSIVDYSHRP